MNNRLLGLVCAFTIAPCIASSEAPETGAAKIAPEVSNFIRGIEAKEEAAQKAGVYESQKEVFDLFRNALKLSAEDIAKPHDKQCVIVVNKLVAASQGFVDASFDSLGDITPVEAYSRTGYFFAGKPLEVALLAACVPGRRGGLIKLLSKEESIREDARNLLGMPIPYVRAFVMKLCTIAIADDAIIDMILAEIERIRKSRGDAIKNLPWNLDDHITISLS